MKKHGLGQHWNAHQVYTWVYTRNPRLVVLLSDRDKGDSFDPNPIVFLAMANRPGAEFADYAEAQEAIVSTLQEDRLRALGRREGAGALEEIPAVEWVDLHFVWHIFHGWAEAVSMTDNPPASILGAPRWHDLRFKSDDVLELWPPTETEIETGSDNAAAEPASTRRCGARRTKNPRGAGRKKGSGSFEKEDELLLEKMKPLVTTGAAPWDAALTVVGGAAGKGTDESRAKRLLTRFKEREKNNSV